MKKDIIAMSQKERQRYHLLKMVLESNESFKEKMEINVLLIASRNAFCVLKRMRSTISYN